MDRLAYIAMTGAQQILQQQAVAANNLAQAGTPGFKADSLAFRVVPVVGAAPGTRAYAVATTPGADMRPGPVEQTGRVLDVALDGNAMLAVQSRDGLEAYTRAGRLAISSDGELRTHGGLTVLGEGGPIAVPEGARLAIARDGTVSAVVESQGSANVQVLGRLKLVTPGEGGVVKGADSLFRTPGGGPLDADDAARLTSGALEGSNVNTVDAMVDMIGFARQFEMQMKLLQYAEANDQRASQLLSPGG
ncbi:MAG: flagellar basal body rod protein FlgF [Burkholderiales bacterium]|nr:flagellar basal body rod protein FlgF [Burkholderiales bacterium]MCE7876482.1 flagellar basal body rod protein FlgF [Betaproteobacteria bacterium PRO3]